MAGESFAIIAVIFVMDVMLLRTGRKAAALFSLPLISVPLFYLMAIGVAALVPLSREVLFPGMVVAGALVGIAGCAALMLWIKNRTGKTAYLALGVVYLVALAIAYLIRILPR